MKKQLINLLTVILFVSISCETVVDINIPIPPASLVANGVLNPDSTSIRIDLSSSDFILSQSEFLQIENATFSLKEDGVDLGTFTEGPEGIYILDKPPLAGKKYELSIAKNGYETITASTTIPEESVGIEAVTVSDVFRNGSDYTQVKIRIKDPAEVANFYEVGLFYYDQTYNTENGEPIEGDSTAWFQYVQLDGTEFENDASSYGQTVLLNDLFFNGLTYEIDLLVFDLFNSGPDVPDEDRVQYYVTVRNASEEYYEYIRTHELQNFTEGDPFSEPVIVEGNIQNGYGIFAGFSSSVEKLEKE